MIRKITMSLIALMLVFALVSPVFADYGETETEADVISAICSSEKTHPVIDKLAFTFGLEYKQVLEWFCDGYDLSTIKQALRTAAASDVDDMMSDAEFLDKVKEYLDKFADEDVLDPDENEIEDPDEGENGDDDMGDKSNSFYCRLDTEKQHPTALRYAELYKDVIEGEESETPEEGEIVASEEDTSTAYNVIMGWFCDGYGFGQIKHALNTAKNDDEPDPNAYLVRREAGEGWGVIWKDVGKPAKVHPVFGENWPNGKKNSTQEEGDPVVTSPQGKGKPNKPGK